MIDLMILGIFLGFFLCGLTVGLAIGFGLGQQHILMQIKAPARRRHIRTPHSAFRSQTEVIE